MSAAKELIFEEEARSKLQKGVSELAQVVGVTLGPKGRNVGIDSGWGAPSITNDGNTVVSDIELKDQYLNMGVSFGKQVASKMKEVCGDGTTSSILLLDALVSAGVKNIASGASPIGLKRGIDKAVEAILAEIDSLAHPIQSDAEILSIATISASDNAQIGGFIAEAFKKVGRSGVITIEEGQTTETKIELALGMQLDRGYLSSYFCTNAETLEVELHNALVLVTDKKISTIHDILPLLQTVGASGAELLIIADDIEGEALSTLVINKLRGTLKVAAIKAPGFGDRRKSLLLDIAVLTGATLVSEETGMSLKDATSEQLGHAGKITIGKDKTTIVDGQGTKEAIAARIVQIEAQLDEETSSYEKEKLEERAAKLRGGVAVIQIGASTEPEMKQKKQVFQDSLSSTRAALEEGVVAGGGVALLRARKALERLSLQGDEALGAQIVFKACETPARTIAKNAGVESSLMIEQVLAAKDNSYGFNASSGKIENLLVAGVIDPAKVVKNSLKFSSSVAGIILLSEVLIGEAPEDKKEA